MKRIIAATDLSPEAAPAIEHAARIARLTGAEILIVHALDPEHRDAYAELHAQIDSIQRDLHERGVRTAQRIVLGHADTSIPETAADVAADLVVVGTHGRTGVKRFLMGSVAERVARTCQTDVMIARGHAPAGEYVNVLVPTDFSEGSERALQRALSLAAPAGRVDLFHAWQLPGAVAGYWGPAAADRTVLAPLREELIAANAAQANKLIERYRSRHAGIRYVEAEGPPTAAIRARIEAVDYDLVVMGSHGRRGFRRFMLGSVAELTARYAPCSVLVVHAGERAA